MDQYGTGSKPVTQSSGSGNRAQGSVIPSRVWIIHEQVAGLLHSLAAAVITI